MISGSPSNSSTAKFLRSRSTIGRNGMSWPKETHWPSSHVAGSSASAIARRSSWSSRDLPMPASPATNITCPRPAEASRKRSTRSASSCARPTNGVRPRSWPISMRERVPRGRCTSKARTGSCPFTATWPRSRVSKKPSTAARVASVMITVPGRAVCCMRAARFVVSPTAV